MSGSNSSAPGSAPARSAEALAPLSLTVHSMPAPSLSEHRRTKAGRFTMLLVLLACAAPVVASYLAYYVVRPGARSNYGELIEPNRELPAADQLPLADESGQIVGPERLRGQWLLVVATDGACDAHCEKLLYAQRQLRESLGRERGRVDRVWIALDTPPRDALMPAMREATVLRTSRAALARWLQAAPGRQLGDHLYLVDPMGRWMMRFPPDAEPTRVKRDLERLLRASSSWDREGR
jgi:hypothetical protein